MKKSLFEGFAPSELKNSVYPEISVDEYSAKSGANDDTVTLAFYTKSKVAGSDLSDWFSTGYDWVIDSEVSEGEAERLKFIVFVELERRFAVPSHILELVEDLETLTELPVSKWKVTIEGEDYPVDVRTMKEMMPLSPHEYRLIHPEEKDDKTEFDPEDEEGIPGQEPPEEPEDEIPPEDEMPPESELPPPPQPGGLPPAPQPGAIPQPGAVPPPQPGGLPPAPQAPLQEMRTLANLAIPKSAKPVDKELRDFLNRAGM